MALRMKGKVGGSPVPNSHPSLYIWRVPPSHLNLKPPGAVRLLSHSLQYPSAEHITV